MDYDYPTCYKESITEREWNEKDMLAEDEKVSVYEWIEELKTKHAYGE